MKHPMCEGFIKVPKHITNNRKKYRLTDKTGIGNALEINRSQIESQFTCCTIRNVHVYKEKSTHTPQRFIYLFTMYTRHTDDQNDARTYL